MATQEVEFGIDMKGGPSAVRFIDAFKYAYDEDSPMTATFTLDNGIKICFLVCSIEHIDGSGEHFNAKGVIVSIDKGIIGVKTTIKCRCIVRMWYDSRRRYGRVFFNSTDYALCKL